MSVHRLDLPADPVQAARSCLAIDMPTGDPSRLRATADALARTAEDLRSALAQLRTIADLDSTWSGQAASAFKQKAKEPAAAHLDDVPERYAGYARLLRRYAAALDRAQLDLPVARSRVADALAGYQSAAGAAHPAVQPQMQECAAAARRFGECYDDWVDAVSICVHGLRRIDSHDRLHNPHGWQAFVDTASTVMGDISTITAVLGILSLAICPPAAAVLLGISTATSAVAFGADLDRTLGYGENLSTADLAADALGCIPATGAAKGVRAGYQAAAAASDSVTAAAAGTRTLARELGGSYRTAWQDAVLGWDDVRTLRLGALQQPHVTDYAAGLWTNRDTGAALGGLAAANTADDHSSDRWADSWRSPLRVVWKPLDDILPRGVVRERIEDAVPYLRKLAAAATG